MLNLEMKQIAGQYPESDDQFSCLEEFELLIASLSGYAHFCIGGDRPI